MNLNILLNIEKAKTDLAKQQRHYRFKVKKVIQKLDRLDFLSLCYCTIHSNHYPLLEQYIEKLNEWQWVAEAELSVEEIKRLQYLIKSYKKTLIHVMCDMKEDGYHSGLVEWLVINKLGEGL